MKNVLSYVLLLCLATSVSAQTPKAQINHDRFTVDTNACLLNTPVLIKTQYLFNYTNSGGIRYNWKIDFGDSTSASGIDTLFSKDGYKDHDVEHTYTTSSLKTLKFYLSDSSGTLLDSVIRVYNIGNCVVASGLVYNDARNNCAPDYGEAVYGNSYSGFFRNGILEEYQLDTFSYYHIPVFPGDSITYKNRPTSNFHYYCLPYNDTITSINLHPNFSTHDCFYYDTVQISPYICTGEIYWFLFQNVHRGYSGNTLRIRYNLNDGSGWSGYLSNSGNLPVLDMSNSFRFTSPGDFHVVFELYDNWSTVYRTDRWIHVADCRPVNLDLYYDGNGNCLNDSDEAITDGSQFILTSKQCGPIPFSGDANGHISIPIYANDTLTLDTIITYRVAPYNYPIYNFKSSACNPKYITQADSLTNVGFVPNYIEGNVYNDKNKDCIKDSSSEKGISRHTLLSIRDTNMITAVFTDSAGYYRLPLIPGSSYSIVTLDTLINGLNLACGKDTFSITTTAPNTVHNDIAYQCKQNPDATIEMYHGRFVPGDVDTLYININKAACLTDSATIHLTLDSAGSYVGSSIIPSNISGSRITFTVADTDNVFPIKVAQRISSTTSVGAVLCYTSKLLPDASDPDTSNNVIYLCDSVWAGYNDYYMQQSVQDDSAGNVSLIYTIGLNNIDTSTVRYIKIVDTLSTLLDVASANVYESSEPVSLSRANNILTIRFYNTQLPPRSKDPIHCNAFVRVKIKPLYPDTLIANHAFIYTDNSKSKYTNTVYYPITKERNALHVSNVLCNSNDIMIYPDPAINELYINNKLTEQMSIAIVSMDGRILETRNISAGINTISLNTYTNGTYVLLSKDKNGHIVKRQLIIKANGL